MVATAKGRINWSMSRDEDGHRNYTLVTRVKTSSVLDGPYQVMNAGGLPTIGSPWFYGTDFDSWARCLPVMEVTPEIENEPNIWWQASQQFSTRPIKRCQDQQVDDPLQEPPTISGSFIRRSKLIEEDRNSSPIKSSSHELMPGITMDDARPTVVIGLNTATINLETFSDMINTVNDAELWGLAVRTIKLSNISWSRQLFGLCNFYYTRRFEFDINTDTFDEDKIIDKGLREFNHSKHGNVADDDALRSDPTNFRMIRDNQGEKVSEPVLLDGFGRMNTTPTVPVYISKVEKYPESNFLLLGVPTVIA